MTGTTTTDSLASGLVPVRADVPREQTWDIESVFPTGDAWEAALRAVDGRLPELAALQGTVGGSAKALLTALRLRDELYEIVEKVQVFATLRRAEDTTDATAAAMDSRGYGLLARFESASAFIPVEILAIPADSIAAWLRDEPDLATYRHLLTTIERRRPFTRSAEVEAILAQAQDVTSAGETIAQNLTDGELPLGTIQDEDGQPVELLPGNLDRYLRSPDRSVRQSAWEHAADAHLGVKNTLAAALEGGIKKNDFYAKARGYDSALAAALAEDAIPTSVFDNLLDTVWKNLPVWHRYFRTRRKLLGLAEGDYREWDIVAPIAADPVVPYDAGVDLILRSLEPLGDEYVAINRQGIADRWVDRCANQGKGAGAFSWGPYRTKPFISMVYDDTLGDVSTLTHELGHSLHAYYTWQAQPITYWRDGGFLVEVPSNFHQAMLGGFLLNERDDRDWTIAVIEERMANHLRYLFTMPILARFERDCHDRIARGDALTADGMTRALADLYADGYGDEVAFDRNRTGITWARFPSPLHELLRLRVRDRDRRGGRARGPGSGRRRASGTTVRHHAQSGHERRCDRAPSPGWDRHGLTGAHPGGI
jgi:oligoendopeptidase F